MFNSGFFIRALIAVIVAIALIVVIPAVLRLVGFPTSPDLDLVIKVVIAICALFYVFKGSV
jgi:hypothetical protein